MDAGNPLLPLSVYAAPGYGAAAAGPSAGDDVARWRRALGRFYAQSSARRPARTHYYYSRIVQRLRSIVEPNRRVLDLGCGDGTLLAALRPSVGVGVDLDAHAVRRAAQRHEHLRFMHMAAEDVARLGETFDYVLLSQTLGEIYDLQALFASLHAACHPRTRLVIVHYSRVWQPALKLMEWLRIKQASPTEQNWLPTAEVIHLLDLCGFRTVRTFGMTLAPLWVPLFSAWFNRYLANLPLLDALGLSYVVIARPVGARTAATDPPKSVSIVVPARNEAGNIGPLLSRIPRFANRQEVIFVEGGSGDHTWEAIQDAVHNYRGPFRLAALRQDGRGKADAVRKGFAAAGGDVLMILDADLSVPPEELPRFYEALCRGQGELVNGSRMVYLMDRKAMRFLNLLGNRFFGAVFTYLLSQRFRDTLCGTKALLRSDYERIAANRPYFGDFDPFGDFDLLFGAARLNLEILDVPVHYKARSYGETNISRFRHGWVLLRMCAVAARKLKFV